MLASENKTNQCVIDFGTPKLIIRDNGGEFHSSSFKRSCRSNRILQGWFILHHSRGNSVSERMHQTLEEILAAICGGFPGLWPAVLRKARQVVHTGLQHFHAFFGRHPPRLVGGEFPDIKGEGSAVHGEEILKLCQSNRRNEADKLGSLYGLRWSSLPQVPCKNWA